MYFFKLRESQNLLVNINHETPNSRTIRTDTWDIRNSYINVWTCYGYKYRHELTCIIILIDKCFLVLKNTKTNNAINK